jgi:hypothetical protein
MVEATLTFEKTSHHIITITGMSEQELLKKVAKLIYRQENPKPNNQVVHVEVNKVAIEY